MNTKRLAGFLVILAVFLWEFLPPLHAVGGESDSDGSAVREEKKSALANLVQPGGADVKKIEEKEEKTQEVIAKNEQDASQAKEEADRMLAEKEALEKETELKEQAAVLAKQELELVIKEAKITDDPKAKKKARELSRQVGQLEKEAGVYKEKLALAESRAQIAQEGVAASEARIETMRKELARLRKAKAAKRGVVGNLLSTSATVLTGMILLLLLRFGIRKFEETITPKDAIRESEAVLRLKTLSKLFYGIGVAVVLGFIAYAVLESFGVDVTPLLAGAGIVGLAFGFGGQYLIRDIISGIFIVLEGQYRIHDVVKIGDYGGLVEGINLRSTTLRDLEGRVIVIPNGEIKMVVNYTKDYAYALLDVGVAYKENVDKVMEIIKQVGKGMREEGYFGKLILDHVEVLGVESIDNAQVTIRFRIKTLPIKQWEVAREFRRRLKNRFDELGIEVPSSQKTIYLTTGPDQEWVKAMLQQNPGPKT